MKDSPNSAPQAALPQAPQYIRELDPMKVQAFQERIREEQNLVMGVLGGSAAAVVAAIAWGVITFVTNYQIGWMAIGVGFLVGWAMRVLGKGVDKVFGYIAAGLSLLGCVAGNLLMIAGFVAREASASIVEVLLILALQPDVALQVLADSFSPIDLLFYGFAVYYGYRYAFRRITPAERENLLRTRVING